MEKPIVLGVDIGGSHITAALVDIKNGNIIRDSYNRKSVNSRDDAEKIINSWCEVISESFNNANGFNKKIGIAIPGPFDYENGISLIKDQDKFNSLYNLNIKKILVDKLNLNTADIIFLNDAAAFLKGEVLNGAGRGFKSVLGLTLGTGLGSAIFKNNKTEDSAFWCVQFKNGIAEDYLSGRWFVTRYNELTGKAVEGVKELVELKDSFDIKSQLFLEFAQNLSDFICPIVENYQLEAVVIGGNISNTFDLFLPELKRILKQNNQTVIVNIAELKEEASLIGAASCQENILLKTTS